MKLLLEDGCVFDYSYDDGIETIVAYFADNEEAKTTMAHFTPEALSEVKVVDEDEVIIETYYDLKFVDYSWMPVETGVEYIFKFRTPSELEIEVKELNEKVDSIMTNLFIPISATMTDITVPADGRTNVQIPIPNIPEGFFFGAYREVSLAGSDSGFENCAIQFFGSASNGTKANIGIKNFSNSDVTINVNVTVLFMKDFSQNNEVK